MVDEAGDVDGDGEWLCCLHIGEPAMGVSHHVNAEVAHTCEVCEWGTPCHIHCEVLDASPVHDKAMVIAGAVFNRDGSVVRAFVLGCCEHERLFLLAGLTYNILDLSVYSIQVSNTLDVQEVCNKYKNFVWEAEKARVEGEHGGRAHDGSTNVRRDRWIE